MIRAAASVARCIGPGVAVVIYALTAHYFSSATDGGPLGLFIALTPLSIALGLKLRTLASRNLRAAATLLLLATIGSAWLFRSALAHQLAWVYFLQDLALNIALAYLFGHTLIGDSMPLCSRFAAMLQPTLSLQLLAYTRKVTVAWTAFFLSVAAISSALFFSADRAVWSIFANILYWPLLLSMFGAEYLVRMATLPRDQRAGFFAAARAFRAYPKTASTLSETT